MKFENGDIVIAFDTETNGLSDCSVLSISALKGRFDGEKLVREGALSRYYFAREPYNPSALAVNGLFPEVIEEKRSGASYPKFFDEDGDPLAFLSEADWLCAHNISFDINFLPVSFRRKRQICTMKSNAEKVGIPYRNGGYKLPRLEETARAYGIPFDPDEAHGAQYDTEICFRILEKMAGA